MSDSEDNTPQPEGDGDDLSSDQELSLNYEEEIVWPDSDSPDDRDGTATITTAGEEDPSPMIDNQAINVRLAQKDQTLRLTETNTRQSTSDVGSADHITPLLLLDTNKYKPQFMDLILKSVLSGHKVATESVTMEMLKCCDPLEMYPKIGKQLLDFCNEDKESKVEVPPSFRHHSPLMIACEQENSDIVKILLERGASVAHKSKDCLNTLHIACNNGNLKIVEMLLTVANEQKHFCLKKTFKSDREVALNTRNQRGWTPLMFALARGHAEIINMLVNTGEIDFTKTTKKKCTVVHIAAGGGVESLKAVISALPEPDEANEDSQSNVCLATDKNGRNVLHHVCAKGTLDSLMWLLDNVTKLKDAETLNHQSKTGYTPLLVACEYQKQDIVEHLLSIPEVNVSLCAKDYNPKTKQLEGDKSGLHLAAIHDAPEIAKIVLDSKGCPIDKQDIELFTQLIKKSSFDVIKILEQADNGSLKGIRNSENLLPSEVTPDDIIPPEIIKRGKEVIARYKNALKGGKKEKIPRCSLLFLGDKRVGKTSVYRLLVLKGFNHTQESTKGIDNTDVNTVDRRDIGTGQWEEMKEGMQKEQSDALYVRSIVKACGLSELDRKVDPKYFKPIEESQLIEDLERIMKSITLDQQAKAAKPFTIHIPRSHTSYADHDDFALPPPLQHESTTPPQPMQTTPARKEVTKHVREVRNVQPQLQRSVELSSQLPHSSVERLPVNPRESRRLHTVMSAQVFSEGSSPFQPKPASPPSPRLSRKHRKSITKELKSGDRSMAEPSLILNALDFAGQKEYRPMHHCFIIRRAMYVLVFNLQRMLEYIDKTAESESEQSASAADLPKNPIEEIRYWLHSIHAHIYPPDEPNEEMSRVCLVGTHRAPEGQEMDDKDLKKIHESLKRVLSKDDRCINHLSGILDEKRMFIAVENSMDGKEDRVKSGAKALQDELKRISGRLKFLNEDRPITWIRFEAELMRLRETVQTRTQTMLAKLEDLRQVAINQGISDSKEQEDAFQFFHDIGKLVCLRLCPKLFLKKDEQEVLKELVILDQSWLIAVMKEIFEVRDNYNNNELQVPPKLILDLEETGIASSSLLKKCWSKFLDPTDKHSFRYLCLILQAHCLIYPVTAIDIPNQDTEATQSTDEVQSQDGSPCGPKTDRESFLIPSKLPEVTAENGQKDTVTWISFHFDFHKFLPAEIFHRLICLMLASIKDKTRRQEEEQFFYSTCCCISCVEGCKWKIELEREQHRLKISILPRANDKLEEYITTIHTKYLMPICQQSNLQGLEYYGGPLVTKCVGCSKTEVIGFVGYANGKEIDSDDGNLQSTPEKKARCSKCGHLYDVPKLLKEQIVSSTREETPAKPEPVQLTLSSLTLMKRNDEHGKPQRLCIIEQISPKWKKVGTLLEISHQKLTSIAKDQDDQESCCTEVLSLWFENQSIYTRYPLTWDGLCELLEDIKCSQIASDLKTYITH